MKSLLINNFETYEDDVRILKDLGLKTFCAPIGTEVYLGKHKDPTGTVKVWVTGLPAQFFRFEIFCAENKKTTKVSTGSGCFSDYWPMVEKIMNGMFVIKEEA